ncbi:MAG: STAS domain-containing protein [Thermoanaerobaculales bacterium]
MTLTIKKGTSNEGTLINVQGEVDLYTSPDLRTAIMEAVGSAEAGVAVDLGEVEYMDSSGVATLVEGFKRAHERSKSFKLVAPSHAVMKVLELAKLDGIFEIEPAS